MNHRETTANPADYELLLFQHTIDELLSQDGSGVAFGVVREPERLIQVFSLQPNGTSAFQALGVLRMAAGDGVSTPTATLTPQPWVPRPATTRIINLGIEFASRREPVLHGTDLDGKKALLLGAGSVGSVLAVQLAQAGLGSFDVVDPDRLEASNLTRHACGLNDLGRPKTAAVADLIRQRGCRARAIPANILEMPRDEFQQLVQDADLVVASMDSIAAQFLANEACVAAGKPALFIGAYERASAGEILAVLLGGPCLYCAAGFRGQVAPLPENSDRPPYQGEEIVEGRGEPGLAIDLALYTSVAAAYALALLDPEGPRRELIDLERRFVLLQSAGPPLPKYAELFTAPLDLRYARVQRSEPCPVCGFQNGGVS